MSDSSTHLPKSLHLLDDVVIVDRVLAGNRRAFQILVERHQGALRTWLRRASPQQHLADDIAQESFVKAWRNLGAWNRRGSFRSWLFGIAAHAAADARRSHQRTSARDGAWLAEDDAPLSDPTAAMQAALDVERALAALPLAVRQVLALCDGAGFSHQEAADALKLPLGTVKSHVANGRAKAAVVLSAEPTMPIQSSRDP